MKKLLTFAFAVAAATMAQASYLYWQTSAAEKFNGNTIAGYNLYAVGENGGKITTGILDADGDAISPIPGNGLAGGFQYIVDVSKYDASYSFYVELIGYDVAAFGEGNADVIGVSAPTSYTDLVSAGSILPTGHALTIPTAWTGGTVQAPEPTSAMLMLLGMAGLALKRRKA